MARRQRDEASERATAAVGAGWDIVAGHPLFAPLAARANVRRSAGNACPANGWAVVEANGTIHAHPTRRGSPQEWAWVFGHALLHLGFGHSAIDHQRRDGFPQTWGAAACVVTDRFLAHMKIGAAPYVVPDLPEGDEELLAVRFAEQGYPPGVAEGVGTAGTAPDMIVGGGTFRRAIDWQRALGVGLQDGVAAAVAVAGGKIDSIDTRRAGKRSAWRLALSWFNASYPLLGGLASGLGVVEDAEVCRRYDIDVAAICASSGELYLNPHVTLDDDERRFVIAHELLHAGLRHDTRSGGRDAYLWNVACDVAVNGWLVEMHLGSIPDGCLHDPALSGRSAEEIYDTICGDLRRWRKVATLAGAGRPDVLPGRLGHAGESAGTVDLDEFYRRALATGLTYHQSRGRTTIPAGLVEEIRALAQPPIPWDVALARWFDEHFTPLEARHSYARPSRRQSSTPDIPRPSHTKPFEAAEARTFGVVLDTSGSMDPTLLGKALGAIASYAASHDVAAARVVFCDAYPHDTGWMPVSDIAERVEVRGRGGTVLQPGVDLLESANDFPADGPILILTDGWCDRLRVRRDHAYLLPQGSTLPFPPKGPVFRFA